MQIGAPPLPLEVTRHARGDALGQFGIAASVRQHHAERLAQGARHVRNAGAEGADHGRCERGVATRLRYPVVVIEDGDGRGVGSARQQVAGPWTPAIFLVAVLQQPGRA